MSKATKKRHRHQDEILRELSYRCPASFDAAWEKRLDSWLQEIRRRARIWRKGGIESWRLLFDVSDRAMAVLRQCSPEVQRRNMHKTIELLEGACAYRVSRLMDRRMYRTNKLDPELLAYLANGGRGEKLKSDGEQDIH